MIGRVALGGALSSLLIWWGLGIAHGFDARIPNIAYPAIFTLSVAGTLALAVMAWALTDDAKPRSARASDPSRR